MWTTFWSGSIVGKRLLQCHECCSKDMCNQALCVNMKCKIISRCPVRAHVPIRLKNTYKFILIQFARKNAHKLHKAFRVLDSYDLVPTFFS